MDWHEKGKSDYHSYHNSQAFGSLTKNIKAEDAAKLFLPNENESMSQISMPYSRNRREWLLGWKEEENKAKDNG